MRSLSRVLLTGATGLLGRYLLRDLLLEGEQVAVLVRDTRAGKAPERIAEIISFWSEQLGRQLPHPQVLNGDVRYPNLGLDPTDRQHVATCTRVLHSAASLTFRRSADGDPFATNVDGTRNLLELCKASGIAEFHHVSTAFVSGETTDLVLEDDLDRERCFNNVYEQSKWEAEQMIRGTPGLHATFYRPSIILGDSRTGYTSTYHGIYRFVELAARMAEPPVPSGVRSKTPRRLNMRLPFTGNEPRNLVAVDWVSQAIVRLLLRPTAHGRVYHLTSPEPVPARLPKEVGETVMNVEGVLFAGAEVFANPSPLEQLFLDYLEEYWTYLGGDPRFDNRNLISALPDLPPVVIDRALLVRLIEFGAADQWGKKRRGRPTATQSRQFNCRRYLEEEFPAAARLSSVSRAEGLSVHVALDISGAGGGEWTLGWDDGELAFVRRGLEKQAAVVFRTDPTTFSDVVRRQRTLADAFFNQLIEIEGDMDKALKLAGLLDRFFTESVDKS